MILAKSNLSVHWHTYKTGLKIIRTLVLNLRSSLGEIFKTGPRTGREKIKRQSTPDWQVTDLVNQGTYT